MNNWLRHELDHSLEIKDFMLSSKEGYFPIEILGPVDSFKLILIEYLVDLGNKNILLIAPNEVRAYDFHNKLSSYGISCALYPSRDINIRGYEASSLKDEHMRLEAIRGAKNSKGLLIVATVEVLFKKMRDIERFYNKTIFLERGSVFDIAILNSKLNALGYERVDSIESKGQYSVRGGIVDVFSIGHSEGTRIEFFGDEIDTIRALDIDTQRSTTLIDKVEIFPAREHLFDDDELNRVLDKLKGKRDFQSETLYSLINSGEYVSSHKDDQIEAILGDGKTLLEQLGNSFMVIADQLSQLEERIIGIEESFRLTLKNHIEESKAMPEEAFIYLQKDAVTSILEKSRFVSFSMLQRGGKLLRPKAFANFSVIPQQTFHGKLDMLEGEIKRYLGLSYKVMLCFSKEDNLKRIKGYLDDKGIEVEYELRDIPKGFELPNSKLLVISDKDIYGEQSRVNRPKSQKGLKSFTDLKVMDYVVHDTHGIGQYLGIKELTVEGFVKDYLHIQYRDSDTLYLPVEQIALLQKYVGGDAKQVKLSKMAGKEWINTKAKVKSAIKKVAFNLLELYAKRRQIKGYAFSEDNEWQKNFEQSFIHIETDDQLKCVEEIKTDMQSSYPMDRLLCGDVGYGKTEVALRAAFKAVLDEKQVAFLVPTTILAQQHYSTMLNRFRDFPVNIDVLSRFRSGSERSEIVRKIQKGSIDILVGTHSILNEAFNWKNLGLLIIDEEQRFGVEHKEKIKNLRSNIDVLTLSATPIPRTLNMSLSGIRDMSLLEDPPSERYPVSTFVIEEDMGIIVEAIRREIGRGGQVYYVYNKVRGIIRVAKELKDRLGEDVRVGIAHGQMNETELEKTMVSFYNGEIDVLVCTTIIETGMDIPNVNTIIITEADRLGLSQLYQLRGRVGRSNRLGYCYLTYKKDKVLTEISAKRLKAIKEFTEFGSGFKVAMRDLEIRGSGDLLGGEQHGHMLSVGYEMYCTLLDETIKEIKGEEIKSKTETVININVDAYIPSDYIESENLKIEAYKDIAGVESEGDCGEILDYLIDRFGEPPKPVINLIDISYIRYMASNLMIESITHKDKEFHIQFSGEKQDYSKLLEVLNGKYRDKSKLNTRTKALVVVKYFGGSLSLEQIKEFLESIR